MSYHDEVRKVYAAVDALFAGWSCDVSTDCCHFARTGREPYLTPIEWAYLQSAMAKRPAKKARLPTVDEGRCPLLGPDHRCSSYAERPFGCRTFFCERASSFGVKLPRKSLREQLHQLMAVGERYGLKGEPRPLRRWVSSAQNVDSPANPR